MLKGTAQQRSNGASQPSWLYTLLHVVCTLGVQHGLENLVDYIGGTM